MRTAPIVWSLVDALRFFAARAPSQAPGTDANLMVQAADAIERLEDCADALQVLTERSGGKLYDTDQVTGETFDTIARNALVVLGAVKSIAIEKATRS